MTIYIYHNVCLNVSYDLNVLKEGLSKADYTLVTTVEDADMLIYVGCGVRGVWVEEAIKEVNAFLKLNKDLEVIISGCVSNIEPVRFIAHLNTGRAALKSFREILLEYTPYTFEEIDSIISQNEHTAFDDVKGIRNKINDAKNKVLNHLSQIDNAFNTSLSDLYRGCTKGFVFYNYNKPIEYITISRGCLFKCAFCAIPLGRGKYHSVPSAIIFSKVLRCLKKGTKDILLIGDEIGNYGIDSNDVNIVQLIDSILSLDPEISIGIRYIEPKPFLKYYDQFSRLASPNRIFLLYIPIQSGSQRILDLMKRHYEIEQLTMKLKEIRDNSTIFFYTNWLIGFPSETDQDFMLTLNTAVSLDFQINTVIPYPDRPNTVSAYINDKITIETKRSRCNHLRKSLLDLKLSRFKKATCFLDKVQQDYILNLIADADTSVADDTYD